jgi:arsenate reductase
MELDLLKVLMLCTGNSCRWIMAEALINHLGQGRYRAWSTGSHPAGYVHPKAVETLKRHGINPGLPCSKSWNQFADQSFDLVITVCDQPAVKTVPSFPANQRNCIGVRRIRPKQRDPMTKEMPRLTRLFLR